MKVLKEIYEYREMIYNLVKRDLRGRYKGSALGFLWTFLNPLLQWGVYTVVFKIIMRSNIPNYSIFLFVGLVPWMFFSASVTGGSTSVQSSADMVKKIYFPREVLPIAYVTSAFVNMLLTFLVVFAVLIISGFGIHVPGLIFLPIIMIIEYILALGIALLTSALTVYFRDLAYILGIITMAWQFLTPIMYDSSAVPAKLLPIWNLNPMTPIIQAYRAVLYDKGIPQLGTLIHAVILGLIVLLIGSVAFRKLQKGFAEEL